MTTIFVKHSNIVILVSDFTKRETFESLKYWKSKIDHGNNLTFGVVGNNIDLFWEEKVPENEEKEFTDSIGAKFAVSSAKDNPKEFASYIKEIFEEYLKNNKNEKNRKNIITIKEKTKKEERCC